MPIRFTCECGYRLTVPDHRAGTAVRCWKCKRVVEAPTKKALPQMQAVGRYPVAAAAACDEAIVQMAQVPPVEKPVEQPVEQPVERPVEQPKRFTSNTSKNQPSGRAQRKPPPLPKSRVRVSSQPTNQQSGIPSNKPPSTAATHPVVENKFVHDKKPVAKKTLVDETNSAPAKTPVSTKSPAEQTLDVKKNGEVKQTPRLSTKNAPSTPPQSSAPRSQPSLDATPKKPLTCPPDPLPSTNNLCEDVAAPPLPGESSSKRDPAWAREIEPPPVSGGLSAAQDDDEPVRGVEYDVLHRWSAYTVAIGVLACSLIGVAPAAYDVVMYFQALGPATVPLWVYLALAIGLLQVIYAVYLFHLPDWGSVWVVALAMLAQTTLYAMLTAIFFFGRDSSFAQWWQVEPPYDEKAVLWCFLMLCLTGLLTYFAGRTSVSWREEASKVSW